MLEGGPGELKVPHVERGRFPRRILEWKFESLMDPRKNRKIGTDVALGRDRSLKANIREGFFADRKPMLQDPVSLLGNLGRGLGPVGPMMPRRHQRPIRWKGDR